MTSFLMSQVYLRQSIFKVQIMESRAVQVSSYVLILIYMLG